MKICFIWIEKFRNFENFGLNLSSKVKFKYDKPLNRLSKIETDDVPDDFFGNRITDVTALIGKNGSGKSNALELICMMLKGAKGKLSSDFLLITQEDGDFTCHSRFSKEVVLPTFDFPNTTEEYSGTIQNLKIVYFSNVFDQRLCNFDSRVSDISVNKEFSRSRIQAGLESRVSKQISLIDSQAFSQLRIDPPREIIVTVRASDNRKSSAGWKSFYGDKFDVIQKFKGKVNSRIKNLNPESRFISILKYRFFCDVLDGIFNTMNGEISDSIKTFEEHALSHIHSVDGFRTDDITNELLRFIERKVLSQNELLEELSELKPLGIDIEKTFKRLEFLLNIREKISNFEIKYFREGSSRNSEEGFIIDYSPSLNDTFWKEFSDLFDGYCQTKLNWLGISSGHQAYLNLFSSIYTELKHSRSDNVLLCIDEGDLYLHPKWQQEFFDKLINVLPKICNNQIQLILTSHSPFLVSDLPKNNITVLDQSSEQHSFDGIELKSNTFGANLYDLYGDAFFLGDSKVSTFAYSKIRRLIESAESTSVNEVNKAEIINLIEILGDEVLKYGLNKLVCND